MSAIAAVVLCAGQGTRMKSDRAKVLHPVLGRPLCSYPIQRAVELGVSPIVAVVGHQAAAVEQALSTQFPASGLKFALQQTQRGTADAVRAAEKSLRDHSGAVLILYGDVPLLRRETLEGLIADFTGHRRMLSIVTSRLDIPTGYGRIVRDGSGRILKVVEEKDCSEAERRISEINAGIYIADAKFLWQALGQVESNNAQREFYLTDMVELAARQSEVGAFLAHAEETSGVNDRADLARATQAMRARIHARHMKQGVTMLDPSTTHIEDGVHIGADTEVGPNVALHGKTRLGQGVHVQQGCVLTDSEVGDRTVLRAYSVLEQARVGPGCQIGPFARLRPGSDLADGVHVGNFVETKKTKMGSGAKANHLTYLGDAEIGARVNVGAGTITCNYDGVNKHKTVIGDEVFIGSDTQLVAPVAIGAGAYVGAGTTVTKDVPADSLAVSRSPQVVKEGWAARKRAQRGTKVKAG